MSATLSVSKSIKDEFSPEQPGQINVAGEVFFLNLPDQNQGSITSSLYDDSIKGDVAFQVLFLGGLPKEEGGKNFTKQEQTDLRRIFRAIFGPRQQLLPTASQMLSVGRKAIGKKGVAMPSKPAVFQLPCDDKDRDLMIKALEIRRTKLIEQIQTYDKLAINDIHGRYMRDHLKKLNDLLDNQINEARRTKRGCRYTGVIDPDASKPLTLNDERMHRLLEIFAFLLAQGKDPLRALSGRYPIPSQVLPMMANPDAPDIYEYEETFGKERDGRTPEYPETLMKLRKVLEGDAALSRAVEGDTLKNIIKEAELLLFPTNPKRSDGTLAERKQRIADALKMKEEESKRSLAEINGLTTRLTAKEVELKKCTAAKEACEAKVGPLESGEERTKLITEKNKLEESIIELGNQILDLKGKVKAAEEKGKAELEKLRGIQDLAVTRLRDKLKEQAEELEKCEGLSEQLAAAKAEIAELKAKPAAPSEEETAAKAVLEGQVASLTRDLERYRSELAAKETELVSLRAAAAATASSAGAPPDYAEKDAEIARLRGVVSGLEEDVRNLTLTGDVPKLRSEITRLQKYILDRGEFIQSLLRNINAILGQTGVTTTLDEKDSLETVEGKIRSLSTKFSQLQTSASTSTGLGGLVNEGAIICILNAIFMLLKRMVIPNTEEKKAAEPGWERLFSEVEIKARQIGGIDAANKNKNLDDSIIRMFILLKKNHAGLPTVEQGAQRLQGMNESGTDSTITEAQYSEYYKMIETLHKEPPIFSQENRMYANVLLKQLLNTTDIEYTNYTFTNSGEVINTEGNAFNEENIDMPCIFLYLLSLTQKVITDNSGLLIQLGCSVIPGAS